jgi:integrase
LRRPEELLLSIVLEDYVVEQRKKAAAPGRSLYAKKYFMGYFGEKATVASVTRQSIEGYRSFRQKEFDKRYKDQDMASTISVGTLRRELTCLRAALNLAVLNGKLTVAPKIEMPSMPNAKERWLTEIEAASLMNACDLPHLKLFVLMAIHTGARKGAILDLTWLQVDFTNNKIDFNAAGREQTNKKRPVVPMTNTLHNALKEARAKAKSEYVIEWGGHKVLDIKRSFKEACKNAQLSDVTPHTLRHTSATWMAQRGVDMYVISGILGHSATRTTELYAKHHPDFLRSGINALDGGAQVERNLVKNPK